MEYYGIQINNLIEQLSSLPGIGETAHKVVDKRADYSCQTEHCDDQIIILFASIHHHNHEKLLQRYKKLSTHNS